MVNSFFRVVTSGANGVYVNVSVGQGMLGGEAIMEQFPYEEFQLVGNWETPKPCEFGAPSSTVALPIEIVAGTFARENAIGIESSYDGVFLEIWVGEDSVFNSKEKFLRNLIGKRRKIPFPIYPS